METKKISKKMNKKRTHWSKTELKIYILLLCAKADSIEDLEELDLIKSRTSSKTFARLYREISYDDEDTSLTKISDTVAKLEYSHMELSELKKETREVFSCDGKFQMAERNLSKILDNIIY